MLFGIFRFLSRLFGIRSGVYYVNGPDVLPAPLTPEEEAQALARLPCDEQARSTLIEHNLRLVVYIARRFEGSGVGLEDLVSIGTVGLIKAINTFCADKNIKLATYASRCIENEILMYLRRTARLKSEVSFDEPLNTDFEGNELLLSVLYELTALISPIVPIEIKSSLSTPVLSNLRAIYTTSRKFL